MMTTVTASAAPTANPDREPEAPLSRRLHVRAAAGAPAAQDSERECDHYYDPNARADDREQADQIAQMNSLAPVNIQR
jgi:hypothetical protein